MTTRTLDNTLKIKHATLTVEDEKGHVMVIEIDTHELGITNYTEEWDGPYPEWGTHPTPRLIGTRFTLYSEEQYIVSYDQKVSAHE